MKSSIIMRGAIAVISVHLVSSALAASGSGSGGSSPTPTPSPAQNIPPAPVLVAPANGASLVQPITLDWNPTSASGGPIGSYTWQIGSTSGFTTVIASGFTNMDADTSVPTATADKVSGLPNGTYFWRVKATQLVGGAQGSVESAWSAIRSFTITGLGPAPATPAITSPAAGASFHVREFFKIKWSPVAGAHYYLLEIDDEPSFSYPHTLTMNPLTFGTQAEAGWGNALANVYYRVRAVSADNVRSLPSATLNVHITNAAPVPPAVSQVAPAAGASVTAPFFFDWSDTANPQVPGYDLDVDTDPNFAGSFGVLLLQGITRSDFMITPDLLAPGNYFWRVRALHGDVAGPWSPGRAITVNAGPTTPPGFDLFAIITEPGNGYGGNSTMARVMLNQPAPAGGALVTLASDMPQAEVPFRTVTIPAGKTDVFVSPVTTGPVPQNGIIGVLRAAYGDGWEQSSLGVLPILYGLHLSHDSIVGGNALTGTVTLQSAAPPGGVTVRLVSGDTALVRPPATVFIPEGATDADFSIPTSVVSVPTRVTLDPGTESDGGVHPFQISVVLTPPGSPNPPPSLSSLILSQSSVLAGNTVTGTVRLTSPAPSGGAVVSLQGSMEGQVITPANVVVPAGSISATFTTTPAPQVNASHWVFIGARYGQFNGAQARILRIDPAPGPATLLGMGPASQNVIGGQSGRGTVGLVMPAPAEGGVVNLTTDNPSVIHVPASVSIAGGNSTNTFDIGTSPVSGLSTGGFVFATAGGITKSIFVNVAPDPNAPPLLQSMTITPSSVTGGTSATGTVFLSSPAPSGGISVTLSTSNRAVATVPGIVSVPGGQTSANFTVTTFPVGTNTGVTITAFYDTTRSASVTVTRSSTATPTPSPTATPVPTSTLAAPSLVSPSADARFRPGTNITFDWNNVANAASYTIQIDDSNSFPSPFIVNQTLTASEFST
ncbi:MAG TPA: hypothetical protein VJ719_00250, partial [Chthoniobacterales bacterium]|nr:hypothetical protein [Chthoniobacterales bacterium]